MKKLLICVFIAIIATGCGNDGSGTSLPPLTLEEKAELEKIRTSGNLAGQLGHEISQNTKLIITTNNFGEKRGCIISIQAHYPELGLVHPKWNLRVQIGKRVENMIWTSNSLSNNAGEVRLMIGGEKYSLARRVDNEGGRGMKLNYMLLNKLLSSESAKAVSGMLGDIELSNTYDLGGFKKAYKFATAICS